MKKKKRKISVLTEVAIFFLVGIIIAGLLTYFFELNSAGDNVIRQAETYASEVEEELSLAIEEYPAHKWIMDYWYHHPDDLDIEYDVKMDGNTRTAKKCETFTKRHPDLQLRYMTEEQCKALSPEDQKLYAEITYSWLITRINQIKKAYSMDYLFCVVSEKPFDEQFFLFSAAAPGAKRGKTYEDAYVLGTMAKVAETQSDAMAKALKNTSHLADAGNYVDYYSSFKSFHNHTTFLGMTYNTSALMADIEKEARKGSAYATLYQLVLAIICMTLIYGYLISPLKRIQMSIRSYSENKDAEATCEELKHVNTGNELIELADDVANMTREIEDYTENIIEITSEKKRIETELNLASEIQATMLPNIFPPYPDKTEFDIYASMEPAKEVGGDFYDFFLIDDDHLCVIMADVAGKGIPAALFMMATKIVLAHNAKAGKSPGKILTDSNNNICGNNPMEMFVTVWLGILELSTGKLTASNAGHEYPIVKGADGKYEVLKDKHGFVIGGMGGVEYGEYEVMLQPGSGFFLYTDGVPEAMNSENEFFGVDRIVETLNRNPGDSPKEVLKNVHGAVDEFVNEAEQFDDLTMLSLEYKGR